MTSDTCPMYLPSARDRVHSTWTLTSKGDAKAGLTDHTSHKKGDEKPLRVQ